MMASTIAIPSDANSIERPTQNKQRDELQTATVTEGLEIWGINADRAVAGGTIVLAVAAIFTFIATIVTILLVKRQLKATEAALNKTTRALKISKRANRIAREHSNRSLRAWLKIDLTVENFYRMTDGVWIDCKLDVENIGQSPAHEVAVSLFAMVEPSSTVVGTLKPRRKVMRAVSTLLPSGRETYKERLRLSFADMKDGIDAAVKLKSHSIISLDAVVEYRLDSDRDNAMKRQSAKRYGISWADNSAEFYSSTDWHGWLKSNHAEWSSWENAAAISRPT